MKHIKKAWLLILVLLISCQSNEHQRRVAPEKSKSECCQEEFVGSDTSGVFSGIVVRLSELKKSSIQRYLSLSDSAGDTIVFGIFLDNTDTPTENVDEAKLKVGKCVTVHYMTDIAEENGIELSRFYYATRLDYP